MTTILKRSILTALICLAAAGLARAGEARIYLSPQIAQTHLTGSAQVSDSGPLEGTSFDLEDTLDVDPEVRMTGIEGFARILFGRISFGYYEGEAEGSTRLDELVLFNGEPFLPGERVDSTIDMRRYKLLFGYDLGLKVVNIGFMGGAQVIDLDASLEASLHEEQEDVRLPVPVIGVSLAAHPIGWLNIHSELSGLSVTVSGVRTRLLDGFAGVDFLAFSKVGVSLGYRYFTLDAEDDDEGDAIDLSQRGVYAGVTLHL
jgi:hypothetical protein